MLTAQVKSLSPLIEIRPSGFRKRNEAFTLVEMLVAFAVLAIIVVFVTRLFNTATRVTTTGNKHMDADAQARLLLDRMAIDFWQMIKRPDVDYYLKSVANSQNGNDQIAFFAQVSGYYPSTGSQSPLSLVSYRINSANGSTTFNRLERMGKGLVWNGVSPSNMPIVFLPLTIATNWAAATNASSDSDYEVLGPDIFRFEYFYLLKNGNVSETPWDTTAGHTNVNGMQDVAAICVSIAVVDPQSKGLLSDAQTTTLASGMNDFVPSMRPGELSAQWQSVLDSTTDMPRPAISSIRLYERSFDLAPKR
jgi:type II secretory pathway pseudopilin PulG